MPTLYEKYCDYYRPLVKEYAATLSRQIDDIKRYRLIPELFMPAWGKRYETSLCRMAFIGRDTYGWGDDITYFIQKVNQEQWENIFDVGEFQNLDYVDWSGNRYTFWGFALYFLAWLYGIEDWGLLKQKSHSDILSSFAWGNTNSIERWDSKSIRKAREAEPPLDGYAFDIAKTESRIFDSYEHFEKLFEPNIVIISCQSSDSDFYLSRSKKELLFQDCSADLRVYKINEAIIICIPHPTGIMYRSDDKKADYYASTLRDIIQKNGKFYPMKDEFLSDADMSSKFLNVYLKTLNPKKMSTKEAVASIAMEVRRQDAKMTVNYLCDVLNKAGFRTQWGCEYSAGRGSYRMLSWFYDYYKSQGQMDISTAIAEAFTNVYGQYAYDV